MKKSIALLTAAILIICFSMPVFASNEDSPFYFDVGLGLSDYSGVRKKENSTPVYVYVTDGPIVTFMNVYNVYGVSQNSGSGTAFIHNGQKRLIHTHVYENGFSYCMLGAENNPYSGHCAGEWSPDSVGSYPYAN